jgi:hypothetical protein
MKLRLSIAVSLPLGAMTLLLAWGLVSMAERMMAAWRGAGFATGHWTNPPFVAGILNGLALFLSFFAIGATARSLKLAFPIRLLISATLLAVILAYWGLICIAESGDL